MKEFTLTVFTHPACSGCPEAVREAWGFTQQRSDIELKTVSLADKEGLAEARRAGVTVIPALILSRGNEELERWQGMPSLDHLDTAVTNATARVTAAS